MDMQMSTLEHIPGTQILEHIGLVQGNTVMVKHVERDIMADLIVGGEIRGYTELLNEARDEATARMMDNAQSRGANAVVNIRYSTSSITDGTLELFAFGTALLVIESAEL